METIILNIHNDSITKDLIGFLSKHKDSIDIIRINQAKSVREKKKESFLDNAGIWKDSDITLEKIREKAWRQI